METWEKPYNCTAWMRFKYSVVTVFILKFEQPDSVGIVTIILYQQTLVEVLEDIPPKYFASRKEQYRLINKYNI